jgi:hypothetical protein
MQKLSQEQLNEVAVALNVLARHGLLYAGFRRRLRRVAEVRATRHIVVKYEDGDLRYIDPASGKTHKLYVLIPPPEQ